MNVPVVSIPLCGNSISHAETLCSLDRLSAEAPERLVLKLIGPGGLSPEAVLTYHDILTTFPAFTQIITISYSNLVGVDLLLFLAGSPRDIRANAWCYVYNAITWSFDTALSEPSNGAVIVSEHAAPAILPLEMHHYSWDYHLCLQLIGQHVDLGSILDRRLEVADLRELLLVDCGDVDALLRRSMCSLGERSLNDVLGDVDGNRTSRRSVDPRDHG